MNKTRIEELDELIENINKEISIILTDKLPYNIIHETINITNLIDLRVKYEIERAKLKESFSK